MNVKSSDSDKERYSFLASGFRIFVNNLKSQSGLV